MDPTADGAPLFHVAAVPYPGRGHINPMMNLCRSLVASHGSLLISLVVTEEWARLLAPPASGRLRFVTIPDGAIPPERGRGADVQAFMRAVQADMRAPVEAAVDRMRPAAEFVLTDALMSWAGEMGRRRGLPAAALWTHSAAVLLAFLRLGAGSDGDGLPPVEFSGKEDKALAYLPRLLTPPPAMDSNAPDLAAYRGFMQLFSWLTTSHALFLSSPYTLERHAIDALRSTLPLPVHAAGPCIPHAPAPDPPGAAPYLAWLDQQPHRSVLYISLGSYLSATSLQLDEMVAGLSATGIRCMWAARDEGRRLCGLVVPWCDQLRVLLHPSVGGFLTHCGWNSTMEGVFAGVPMLTCPLIWDQYPNSKMIVDDWRIGLRLRDEDRTERVTGRDEVARIARELMDVEGEEGRRRRRRAEELMAACRPSAADLDALIRGMVGKRN